MLRLHHQFYRFWIFIIGVIATIAYRSVVIVNHYSQFWVEVLWYIGTIGFIWYFGHRWLIETRREELIKKLDLEKKIANSQPLNNEDKSAVLYVLKSLSTSLARWNYIAIFFFSFLAIAYAIYLDFVK